MVVEVLIIEDMQCTASEPGPDFVYALWTDRQTHSTQHDTVQNITHLWVEPRGG